MSEKSSSEKGRTFIICAVVALGFAGYMFLGPVLSKGAPIAGTEVPRNEKPMAELTPYFLRDAMKVKGRNYTYFSAAPPKGSNAGPAGYPLVLVLHGAPGNAYAAMYLTAPETAARYPAFVIVPVLEAGRMWATPDGNRAGLSAAVAIVDDFAKRFPVDRNRIYVVGCSDGGTGAFGAARYFPDFFAASVPIAGAWSPKNIANMTNIPIWAAHGEEDEVISFEPAAMTIKAIREAGGNARMSGLPGMNHFCPEPRLYGDALWRWLFAQKRTPGPNLPQ